MRIRGLAWAVVAAVLIVAPAGAKPGADEWKKIEAEARRAFAGSDGDARVKAVDALGAADCVDALKFLLQVLNSPDRALESAEAARDAFEPEYLDAVERFNKMVRQGKGVVAAAEVQVIEKKTAEMDDLNLKVRELSAVQERIADAMGKARSAECVAWLCAEGLKDKQWRARAAVARALGLVPAEAAGAGEALRGVLADKDGRVRAAALEALGRRGAKDAAPAMLAALEDERWQVRVAAAEALGVLGLRETVKPLIERMQKEEGRLREDIDAALKAITGVTFKGDALGWKGWWERNGAAWESGELAKKVEEKPADGAAAEVKPGGTTVTFYGIETKSKNLIFVVDVSGSMAEEASMAPVTDSGGNGGPGPKGKRKIDIARYELARAIGQLPDEARFNIVTFSSDVKVYSPQKMITANKSTKLAAQKFAESLEPQEATNIHDSLEKAFELAGGGKMQVDENYKGSVDTIFFLTDGTPTIGKSKDGTEIANIVKKWNEVRKIRIHCIGIGKHAEDLLKRLAEESGGTYVKR